MELTKETTESERTFYPENEFWDNTESTYIEEPLVEDILHQHCQTLTPNQRKWLLLTVLEGLSVSEIAEKEKVSVSAVKSWRKGARDKLKLSMGHN